MTTETSYPICIGIDIETLTSWLLEKLSQLIGVDPSEIDVHDELQVYGIDSRQFIDLTFELEDFVGQELPTTLFWDHKTIAAVIAALTSPKA